MAGTILSYEDLRKQARHLENDIDLKLVAFSKLGAGINTPHSHNAPDTVPLLSEEDTFEAMGLEIEQLLGKLTQINERMSEQPVSGAAMLHILRRHKDILADLSRDFRKINSQHLVRREREQLLRSNKQDNFRPEGVNRREQYTLKESTHLYNSDRLVNDQISIAMETREHLTNQRQTFKKMQTRFNDISNRFPMLNSLIQRINIRKRRDSIIIGLVVAFAILMTTVVDGVAYQNNVPRQCFERLTVKARLNGCKIAMKNDNMRPDNKSESFTFHKSVFSSNSNGHSRLQCRIKLQERFEKDGDANSNGGGSKNDRSVLSVLSLNDTRKAFRNGAEKISKTISNVRISLGNFSQRFKSSTRRRQILEEGPMTPNCSTPQARTILGRTPTKLYSPFGIESPNLLNESDKENAPPSTQKGGKKLDMWPRKRNLLEDIF
ncbi:Gos28 [Trypoxylus dichotomus]